MQVFFKYAFMPTRGLNAGNALKEENMNETVNQENMTNQNAGTEEQSRTFTQAELDQIVSDRLSREKAKYADYDSLKDKAKKFDQMEEASKSELQKATERADSLQQKLDAMTRAENTRQIRVITPTVFVPLFSRLSCYCNDTTYDIL